MDIKRIDIHSNIVERLLVTDVVPECLQLIFALCFDGQLDSVDALVDQQQDQPVVVLLEPGNGFKRFCVMLCERE